MTGDRSTTKDGVGPAAPPPTGLDVERLDMLRELDPGDTSYLDRAIGNFQVNSDEAVTVIAAAVGAGDIATVKARSHKIAGSALNLGATRAGEAARRVEVAADSGSLAPVVPLLEELRESMAEGRELLLAYQATYAG
ncbi:Hpt domain-containing protein [Nocardioides plantarum]|uniref:Hpt domain-containing protein n=1 Tax=Nocardioides plantarum TaxID=29299 RepID=A0ABV5KE87_9ACTN|nr:Hpt domain-containing protein [Nocardioides plantarum]